MSWKWKKLIVVQINILILQHKDSVHSAQCRAKRGHPLVGLVPMVARVEDESRVEDAKTMRTMRVKMSLESKMREDKRSSEDYESLMRDEMEKQMKDRR